MLKSMISIVPIIHLKEYLIPHISKEMLHQLASEVMINLFIPVAKMVILKYSISEERQKPNKWNKINPSIAQFSILIKKKSLLEIKLDISEFGILAPKNKKSAFSAKIKLVFVPSLSVKMDKISSSLTVKVGCNLLASISFDISKYKHIKITF